MYYFLKISPEKSAKIAWHSVIKILKNTTQYENIENKVVF